nr:cytochrome c [Burkholderia sp. PAMC 26561]
MAVRPGTCYYLTERADGMALSGEWMNFRAILRIAILTIAATSGTALATSLHAAEPSVIQRGAQLAAVGDCIVCHTAKDGAPFAGGLPIHTPFGAIYSTNITPDTETGIGSWTLDAFAQAMRRGKSSDDHLLYPAFPYVHFTHMTDADIASVYAFMMSRTPVRANAPANKLIFPLNFRPLLAVWNLLYLHADTSEPMSRTQDAQLDHGRYLVEGLGHCAACHTPLNVFGAEKKDRAFDGAVIDGWDAPSLKTLLSAPTPWTREQLSTYLRTGLASEHGAAAGPMLPVTHSLANASQADVEAMAAYIMSIQRSFPAAQAAPVKPAAGMQGGAIQAGATLFQASCAACHAAHSPMNVVGGRPLLSQSTSVNSDSPRNVVRVLLDGLPAQGSTARRIMPPFAGMLTDAQIADLANYLRVQYSKQPPWQLQADDVAKYRKETPTP